jgi:glycosyltransferase involved in cell wall biosynthesis
MPPVEAGDGDIFLGLDLSSSILPKHERTLARWKERGVALNFYLYDLLPVTGAKWFTWKARRAFSRWLRLIHRRADKVITISRHVGAEFLRWGQGRRPARQVPTATVYLGGDLAGSQPSLGMPHDLNRLLEWVEAGPLVLMVGTIEPRKGYDRAIKAFRLLWNTPEGSDVRLLIVGRPGWKTKSLQREIVRLSASDDRLRWLADASDELLDLLYSRVDGLLSASFDEGFGLPLLEAIRHGVRVLASDIPIYRELNLPGVEYFKGNGPSDIAVALANWLSSAEPLPKRAPRSVHSWKDATDVLLRAIGL